MSTTRRNVAATAAKQPKSETDAISTFVQELQALTRAQQQAERKIEQSEAALAAARHALAESEASRLVEDPDGGEPVNQSRESQQFITASLGLEQARAALGGVRRRIAERDVQILVVAEKLQAQRQQFNQAAVERFLAQEFQPAAELFAAVLRLGDGLATALGVAIPQLHSLPARGDWASDPAAKTLHDQHDELRGLAEQLEGFRHDAETRTLIAEKNRSTRASFDPSGTYRVIRPFQAYGAEFPVGRIVSSHDIALKILAQLYDAKRLCLVDAKEQWEV